MQIYKKYLSFRGESDPFTWIYRITTNVCINHLKKEAALGENLMVHDLEISDELSGVERLESKIFLNELFSIWDKKTQKIGFLAYVEGLTQTEISKVLRISRKTVNRKLQKIRIKAKNFLKVE